MPAQCRSKNRGRELPEWRLDTARSKLTLHVFASGVLSPLLHDHHFSPTEWNGTVSFDPDRPREVRVGVTIAADSLRNDQPALSTEDHETVNRQVQGPTSLMSSVTRRSGSRASSST